MTPEPTDSNPNESPPFIRDYTLLRKIGSGSYGDVWLARTATGGFRAIKVVYRARFRDPRPYEREFEGLRHFERITLKDRNQLALLHLSRDDERGLFYYVMELADDLHAGVEIDPDRYQPATLANVLKHQTQRYLPAEQVLRIGCELARGLDSLHRHGVVHRDVKPANVVFVGGTAKLADIGLLTVESATDSFVGTEGYVPPEGPGRPAADVYALGRLLYESATGLGRHDYPRLPSGFEERPDKDIFLELNTALIRACDGNPHFRYPSAGAMLQDLLRASSLSLRAMQRREVVRRWIKIAALVVLVAFGVGSFITWRISEREREQRRALASTMAANGYRTADAGDPLGALPWLTAAARKLDPSEPLRTRFLDRAAMLLEQSPSLQVLHSYPGNINDLHFHPTLPLLAVATESGSFDLWDIPGRRIVESTTPSRLAKDATNAAAQSFRFSPDGAYAALADDDGHFHLARFNASHPGLTPIAETALGSHVTGIAFAPGTHWVAIATLNALVLAQTSAGEIEILQVHERPDILTVAWSSDGQWLACSCRANGVYVYSRADGFTHPRHYPHSSYIYCTAFAPEGDSFFSASAVGEVLEWNFTRGSFRTYEHDGVVSSIDLSRDGSTLLSAARDGFLRRWSVRTVLPRPLKLPILPVAVIAATSPDQRYSAGGGHDGQLCVWDHQTPALPPRIASEPTFFVHTTPWKASDLTRLPGPASGTNTTHTARPDFGGLLSADVTPDGSAGAGYSNSPALTVSWRRSSDRTTTEETTPLPAEFSAIHGLEAEKRLVLGSTHAGEVVLWSAQNRTNLWRSERSAALFHWAWLSSDRRWWAWTRFGEAWCVDLEAPGLSPFSLPSHRPGTSAAGHIAVAFSPDSRWMAVGCSTPPEEACPIGIYSLQGSARPTLTQTLTGHRDGIRSLRFSPDSRLLASGGEDGLVFLWRIPGGQPVGTPLVHRGQVQRLEFSPNAAELLTGTRSKLGGTDVLRLWDVRSGAASSPILQLPPGLDATRVAYAPWLSSWIWASGYPTSVAHTPALLFSPQTKPELHDWLVGMAAVLSGRELGPSQQELILEVGDRLRRYALLHHQPPDHRSSP